LGHLQAAWAPNPHKWCERKAGTTLNYWVVPVYLSSAPVCQNFAASLRGLYFVKG